MEIPANYEKLGRAGYVNRQNYSATATYNRMDTVYYQGSTYVALADNLTGVSPDDSGSSWMYLARGFSNVEEITSDIAQLKADIKQPFRSEFFFVKHISTGNSTIIEMSIVKQEYSDVVGFIFGRTSNASIMPVSFALRTGVNGIRTSFEISGDTPHFEADPDDTNKLSATVGRWTDMTFLCFTNNNGDPNSLILSVR